MCKIQTWLRSQILPKILLFKYAGDVGTSASVLRAVRIQMLWEIHHSTIYDSILMKIIWYDQKQPLKTAPVALKWESFWTTLTFLSVAFEIRSAIIFFQHQTADPGRQSLKFIFILFFFFYHPKLLRIIGLKYADKSRRSKSRGLIFLQQHYECKTPSLPTIWRRTKKENPLKPSGNCSPPPKTYSTSVFVHGCKHLDLLYDLRREAAAMWKSHKPKSVHSPRGSPLMSYDILHPLRGKPPKMRCHHD